MGYTAQQHFRNNLNDGAVRSDKATWNTNAGLEELAKDVAGLRSDMATLRDLLTQLLHSRRG